MACLRRGGWMDVTMISRGVEISSAGGVAETQDVTTVTKYPTYIDSSRHNPNPADS